MENPPNLIDGVRTLKNRLLIEIIDMGFGVTAGGIIMMDDDFKEAGIRPRWARVLVSGPGALKNEIWPGGYVLLEHAGWSREMPSMMGADGVEHRVWMTDVEKVLGYDDDKPRVMGKKVSTFIAT